MTGANGPFSQSAAFPISPFASADSAFASEYHPASYDAAEPERIFENGLLLLDLLDRLLARLRRAYRPGVGFLHVHVDLNIATRVIHLCASLGTGWGVWPPVSAD